MRPLALLIAAFLLLPAIRPAAMSSGEPLGQRMIANRKARVLARTGGRMLSNIPQVAKSLHRVIVRYSKEVEGSLPVVA